ncbi:MAG TPA: hypothetical protein VFM24_08465 [Nitrospira sp.]|nr:hypothetical protein [Nitrospira sp.]
MSITRFGAAAVLAAGFTLSTAALVQAAYQDKGDVRAMLEHQGYTHVVIAGEKAPYQTAYGCKGHDDYRLKLDKRGSIVDRDRRGHCGDGDSVAVRAPFSDVDVDNDRVSVRAPFADVHVDKRNGGVHVRAPFVDLHVGY